MLAAPCDVLVATGGVPCTTVYLSAALFHIHTGGGCKTGLAKGQWHCVLAVASRDGDGDCHGWRGHSDLTAGPPYQEGDKASGELGRHCPDGDGDGLICGTQMLVD